jgi:hypothetical protein
MTIRAYRGGSTATTHSGEAYAAGVTPFFTSDHREEDVEFQTTIPAGGKGSTVVTICVSPEDFALVAQAMMDVDPAAAVKAFGAAMVEGCRSGRA